MKGPDSMGSMNLHQRHKMTVKSSADQGLSGLLFCGIEVVSAINKWQAFIFLGYAQFRHQTMRDMVATTLDKLAAQTQNQRQGLLLIRGLSLSELHTIPHHGKLSLTISRVWEKRTCFLWGMSIITRIYCHHRGVDEILPPGINFDHERQWVMQGCKIRSKTLNLATSCQMKPETSSKMWMRREGSTTWSWSRYTPWANMLHM